MTIGSSQAYQDTLQVSDVLTNGAANFVQIIGAGPTFAPLFLTGAQGVGQQCYIYPNLASGAELVLGSSVANPTAIQISDSGFTARSFNIYTGYGTFTLSTNAGPTPPAAGGSVSALTGNIIDVTYITNVTLLADSATGGTDLVTNIVFRSYSDNTPKLPLGVPMCVSNNHSNVENNQSYRLWYQKNDLQYYYFGDISLSPKQTAYIRLINYAVAIIPYSLKIEVYGSSTDLILGA